MARRCVQPGSREPALDVDRCAVLVTEQRQAGMTEREGRVVDDRLEMPRQSALLHAQQRADAVVVRRGCGADVERRRPYRSVVGDIHPALRLTVCS